MSTSLHENKMFPDAAVHLAYMIAAAALLSLVCWHDIATRLLPDGLTLAIGALGVAWQISTGGLVWSLVAATLVFLGAAAFWFRGALGGGDVKLLGACALLPAAAALPQMLVVTALTGGVLALGYLAARRLAPASPSPSRFLPARIWRAEAWRMRRGGPLPYALPIALGTLFAMMAEV